MIQRPTNPIVYFANDTSKYHGGSKAVCKYIHASVARAGWDLVRETNTRQIEQDIISQSDAVLVNGEGTIHDNKPRARHLLEILKFAQSLGKKTYLCNASWHNMNCDYDKTLKQLDQICVRETHSQKELQKKHGINPELFIDLSYWSPETAQPIEEDIRFLASDFYCNTFDCFVKPMGGALSDLPFLDMRAISWQETLNQVAASKVFICGRFHGFLAACKSQTRFIVFPGNTHKIEGMLDWFGNSYPLETDVAKLLPRAKTTHRNAQFYSEFFDWIASQDRWEFKG